METMFLFTYGTLKRGQCRDFFLKDQKFIGEAKTEPVFALYRSGDSACDYPMMVAGNESINGELWEIDDQCRDDLDYMEGHPTLFRRTRISLATHPELTVFAYIYQQDVDTFEKIGESW